MMTARRASVSGVTAGPRTARARTKRSLPQPRNPAPSLRDRIAIGDRHADPVELPLRASPFFDALLLGHPHLEHVIAEDGARLTRFFQAGAHISRQDLRDE